MKILSNKEYEKIINEKSQSYTYYMKDPYQTKKIDELENQNIKLEIELDKKDKEIERLHSIIKEVREKLEYLLTHDKVEINGTIYLKQEADDFITNYILEILDKENI